MVYNRPYITEEHTCTPKNAKLNTIKDVLAHILFIKSHCQMMRLNISLGNFLKFRK